MKKFQDIITKNSFFIAFLFVALGILGYLINFTGNISTSNSDWGSFGSYLAGVTSPILGIVGIVLTYSILNNQNKESRQSEFKFMFQMLYESLEEKKDQITIEKGRKIYKGKEAIKYLNVDFQSLITFNKNHNSNTPTSEIASSAFWSVYYDKNVKGSFATYMKNLHNCLKVIDSFCETEHRKTYADLLRAQMDTDDMIFLLYNGVGSSSFSDFKERLEKFTMLQDIANDTSVDPDIKGLYDSKAYRE